MNPSSGDTSPLSPSSATLPSPSVSKGVRYYYRHREELLEKQRQRYRNSELYRTRQAAKEEEKRQREEQKKQKELEKKQEQRQKAQERSKKRAEERAMRLGVSWSQ
jgi:type IV secretory pathway VirB9-like protein